MATTGIRPAVTALAAGIAITLAGIAIPAASAQSTADGTGNGTGNGTVVRTANGLLRGVLDNQSRVFQGIPYAAPPTGQLRWQLPQPAASWPGVRDASSPAPACAQVDPTGQKLLTGSAEDCLYLNVTTPRANGRNRPVMVWIHGGNWEAGTGSDYDGRWLSQTGDVIVVTINYRLGTLGFLGYPGLPGSGTFALADQQAALRWVQTNAKAFGGDPNNVTVLGESAGALSTCAQVASPTAAGLFRRAIIESGSCDTNFPQNLSYPDSLPKEWFSPLPQVQARGQNLAGNLGCTDLACLRKVDPLTLQQASNNFTYAAYDTPLLPLDPRKGLKYGVFNQVPVMQGNTRDEQAYFGWLYEVNGTMDATSYQQNLVKTFGDRAAAVAQEYPVSAYDSPIQAWNTVASDRDWICQSLTTDQQMARHVPVYSFSFADRTAPPYGYFPPGYETDAYHSSELPYLFNLSPLATLNTQQTALSTTMLRYWTNFARTGNPNGPSLPQWTRFRDGTTTQSFQLGGITTIDLNKLHHCDFWSTL